VILRLVSSESDTGGSGFVITYAPVPSLDSIELPITFIATTLASILSARLKEYGAEVNVDSGTVH
jgi:hypothetical protein